MVIWIENFKIVLPIGIPFFNVLKHLHALELRALARVLHIFKINSNFFKDCAKAFKKLPKTALFIGERFQSFIFYGK